MKFLCDNCKAKYQIADDKVSGKTVRMKCRKCGHQIEVRSTVTETSTSGPPPRPSSSPDDPRTTRSGLATSLSAAKPRSPSSSALAGAFQKTIQQDGAGGAAPGGSLELSVTDEWYVAINGVPVGPVRISELRRKAATGAVTEDSLCWQEGLEEWRPVRTIPELAALVREAAQGNRPSLIAPAPDGGRPQHRSEPGGSSESRPPPPARPTSSPQRPMPPRSEPPRAPMPRSNVVPLHGRVATAEKLDESAAAVTVPLGSGTAGLAPLATAAAIPTPAGTEPMLSSLQAPAPLAPPPPPAVAADPFAVPPPPPPPAPAALAPATPSVFPPAPAAPSVPTAPKRQGTPLWFAFVAIFATVFGVGAAYFVFVRQPPAPVVIQVPVQQPAPPTPSATASAPVALELPASSAEPATSSSATTARPTGPAKPTASASATSEKRTADLSGLLGGAGGPASGPGGAGGGAGGGLDSSSVERVVGSHRIGVRRTCWERGASDQKSSVNVTISATVAPDGSVANTSSSGDDPAVAKCIENQVRTWRFPPPGSSTTVNIPFKFVRQ